MPKGKTRAASAAELEAILEQLMLEVAESHPYAVSHSIPEGQQRVKTWAHMTAMYVSEVVKRRSSDRETIIRKAKRAVRRRIERELADSYLRMVLPEGTEGLHPAPPKEGDPRSGEAATDAGTAAADSPTDPTGSTGTARAVEPDPE